MRRLNYIVLIIFLFTGNMKAQENNRMLTNGLTFLDTPYMAHTLDENEKEELVINRNEVDCTTFVEYVLAMSLPSRYREEMSEGEYVENIQNIRYRDGEIDGYASRLHYMTDWINNNIRNGYIKDVTAARSKDMIPISLSYMSTHPELYKQLKNSPENRRAIAAQEKKLSGQKVHYLPKEKLPDEGLPWIKNGDIIAFTTNIKGLDISHVGLAIYKDEKLHLLHASVNKKKVIIEEIPLSKQLTLNKKVTGIRVLRMNKCLKD